MKTLGMAVLFSTVALLGNLTVDWLTHSKPNPIELAGASIVGMVFVSGFRTKQPKL
jgi:hypothetical protein